MIRVQEPTGVESQAAGATGGLDIMHHIRDSRTLEVGPWLEIHLPQLDLFGVDISITKHVVFMWIAAVLCLAFFIPMARRRPLVHTGMSNFFEAFIIYVRDEIVEPAVGKHASKFTPYIATLFFFILFMNLLGIVPFGSTATSNIAITGTLAAFSLIMIEANGFRVQGLAYLKHLLPPEDMPLLMRAVMTPIFIPIELIGHLTKPFALMIRLFANMTAGHVVILALLSLIFIFRTFVVAPASLGLTLFVYGLEVLIALIQAYIFALLTAMFIGMAIMERH